jgi:hypothetical protein
MTQHPLKKRKSHVSQNFAAESRDVAIGLAQSPNPWQSC